MKIATAIVVGLITFSYAGVASAWYCAPSAPKAPRVHNTYTHEASAVMQMLMMMRGY